MIIVTQDCSQLESNRNQNFVTPNASVRTKIFHHRTLTDTKDMAENYEEVNTFPLRNRGGMSPDDFPQDLHGVMQNRNKNLSASDIVRCVCLILMSIFFVCGANYFEPSTISYYDRHTPVKPTSFIALGASFYITFLLVEVYRRRSSGSHVLMPCLGILGATLWFIATVSSFHVTGENMRVLSIMWIIGTLFNLAFVTSDLYIFLRSGPEKPLFHTVALFLAWLANVLFLSGGIAMAILVTSPYISLCDLEKYAGLYIAGGVFYLLHGIFYTLAHFRGDITFIIKYGNNYYNPGNDRGPIEDVC